MRDILFRGKTEKGDWVYGYLFVQAEGTEYEEAYILGYLDQRESIYDIHKCAERVIPETVGQWMRLVDKNGKKIFEGDVSDADSEGCVVIGNIHDNPELLEEK